MARYALVVGIETYDSQYLKALSKSVADAEDFAKLLEQYGGCPRNHITLLKGRVTGDELISALKKFLGEQAKNQEAIIYFSGHGVLETKRDSLTEEVSRKGYLAASDCQLSKKGDRWIVRENAIPLESITKLINNTELSSLIFVLDACHSGSLIQEIDKNFNIFQNNTTYYFLAACQAYEESWAKKSKRHSEFTGALLDALSREKADEEGIVTAGQAFDRASRTLESSRQKPTFMGKGSSFPFVRYPLSSFLSKPSLPISANALDRLELLLKKIDLVILTLTTRTVIDSIRPQAAIHRPELNQVLDVGAVLQLLGKDFPQQTDGTPSLIALVEQLIEHPQVSDYHEDLKQWLQAPQEPSHQSVAQTGQPPEMCQAYLMVIVAPQEQLFSLRGILWKNKKSAQPFPLHLRDDRPTESCGFPEIPKKLQDFLYFAENRYLQGTTYQLTIELFLPFDRLAQPVDLWSVEDLFGDPRPLAKDYCILVRSYERYQYYKFQNLLKLGWQRWQEALDRPKTLLQRIQHFEPQPAFDPDRLEGTLQDKFALTCMLPQASPDCQSLFKTLIRTGTPLTLWSRCYDWNCTREFQQLLNPERLQDWQRLVEQFHQQRKQAHLQTEPETNWIYHVALWLDNPNRMPLSNLQSFPSDNSYE